MNPTDPIVILSYARTPMGCVPGRALRRQRHRAWRRRGRGGGRARRRRARSGREDLHGLRPARRPRPGAGAAGGAEAGLGNHVEATTVNKMCGSRHAGRDHGADALGAGSADIIVAGGMESMTNAPYLMTKHRGGARIGHDKIIDHMFLDGLEDAYEHGRLMGSFAEESAPRLPVHPRGAGRLRHRLAGPRPGRAGERRLRPRDRRRRGRRPQGPRYRRQGRAARRRATPRRSRRLSPLSPRTARSPPPTPPRSATAPPLWSSPARASPTGSA